MTLTLPAPTVITASLKVQLFEGGFFFIPPQTVAADCKLFQRNHQVTDVLPLLVLVLSLKLILI